MERINGRSLFHQHRTLTARLEGRLGRADAEDLASEAIARALRRPPPDGRQGPWLERIVQNLLVDHWRRRGRQTGPRRPVSLEPTAAGPEEELLGHERRRAVAAAIPALSDDLREAVRLRFCEDRDHEEVAACQGVALITARTRVHRALTWLRHMVGGLKVFAPLSFGSSAQPAAFLLVPAALTALALHPGGRGPRPATQSVAQAASPRASATAPRHRPSAPATQAPSPPPAAKIAPAPNPTKAEPPRAAAAITHFDYGDDEVTGELQRPDDELLRGRAARAPHSSLIEIPSSFFGAIAKMTEEL